ncbi:translation initiation factor IF3-1, mitochondrial [Corylus avellana]|uniref:translation initiation factor IF3-1, mitochondrial n=1 Tax=Corylus avellana TaxID=13451 RepID=UPI00286A7395|nr:translation initiation factor IF3-1, mitochondrial [Corylus avellana]XP_059449241.1 translation initiation factor IF3-1, mitochondrial [Corylus avellana]XP_059449242.1 translation initiation factor IF3-1, mitochondrial [Corylus avellana]XP_059449243.1 translation initiation factor IF3-1, mitochondrial [Corylus avellana]XP_059449244.1 translation initiation factor IF3-1, mitochondrial [Corylus avellana]XP_059449245.1 translation initiation factor IF3-1, mitochondrial [Corylus avellana]XP_05
MMGFYRRINRFKLKHYSHQIERYYLGIPNGASLNSNASKTSPCVVDKPYWVIHSGSTCFCNSVRFFAAPVQAKLKTEKGTNAPRMNGQIKASIVRLVTEKGHEKVSMYEALERAKKLKLDLVEVQRNADPPVCKLMDFHREKYKQQLKEKDRAKSKSEVSLRKGDCKEVRFSGKTELKDLKMKADQVIRLMERGYRVKCRAMGKEGQDLGGLLNRLSALIEEVAVVESGPAVRETEAHVIVRHVKFGTSKKGGGKKLKVTAPAAVDSVGPLEQLSFVESGLEAEEEILSDEDDLPISSSMEITDKTLEKKKNAWSVVDSSDDFEKVFHFDDDVNGVASRSTDKQLKTAQEIASPSSNVNVLDFSHPSPLPNFTRANQAPSFPQGPSFGTENRHKRTEPKNQFSSRLEPQFPNQRRQPPVDMNFSPSVAEGRQVGTDASSSRNLRVPPNQFSSRLEPQFPNQRRQPPVDMNFSPSVAEGGQVGTDASASRNIRVPPNNMPKREPSPPGAPSTPSPGYGIFSSPNASGRGVAAEVHRQSEGNPHDSPRNLGATGDSQRSGLDKGGPKAWGIFSRDSSNVVPNRISKPN